MSGISVQLNNLVTPDEGPSVKRIFDVSKHVRYTFLVAKMLGLFPFGVRAGRFRLAWPFCAVSLATATNVVYVNLGPYLRWESFHLQLSFSFVVSTLSVLLQGLVFLMTLACGLMSVEKYNRTFLQFQAVEEDLAKLRVPWKGRNKDWPKLGVFLAVWLWTSYVRSLTGGDRTGIALAFYFFFISISQVLTGSQFSCLAGLLSDWLEAARSALRPDIAPEVVRLVNHATRAADRLQDLYGRQLLFYFSQSFVIITTNAFLSINQVFFPENSAGFLLKGLPAEVARHFPLLRGLWIAAQLAVIWKVVDSAHRVGRQARELNDALYKMTIADRNHPTYNDKRLSLQFSMRQEVEFSVCGLFPLDRTLIHAIVASAASYLVILIEFGQPDKSAPQTATLSPS